MKRRLVIGVGALVHGGQGLDALPLGGDCCDVCDPRGLSLLWTPLLLQIIMIRRGCAAAAPSAAATVLGDQKDLHYRYSSGAPTLNIRLLCLESKKFDTPSTVCALGEDFTKIEYP
jgi:hypothetical protein